MPRPKGTTFEPNRDEKLLQAKELLDTMTVEQTRGVRRLANTRLFVLQRGADSEEMPIRDRCLHALERVDSIIWEAAGGALETTAQYREHKLSKDPAVSTIYTHLGPWDKALMAADIPIAPYPERSTVKRNGRPPGGGHTWTSDDLIRWVALAIEDNRGIPVTENGLDDFRARRGEGPHYRQVIGTTGRKGCKAARTLEGMHRLAYQHIAGFPELFPRAHESAVKRLARAESS
jgi:hypothetical protein